MDRALYGHQTTYVTRGRRPVAAVVPVEIAELVEQIEDELDLEAPRKALADPEGFRPFKHRCARTDILRPPPKR